MRTPTFVRCAPGSVRSSTIRVVGGAVMVAIAVAGGVESAAQQGKLPWPKAGEDKTVQPVAGPSWLSRKGIKLSDTSLGQGSGQYGPGADQKSPSSTPALGVRRSITVGGADVYRLNCQACHRAEGTGAPPEIKSVVAPLQGDSLEAVRKRVQQEQASAEKTTRGPGGDPRAAVLARIHDGGRRMPPRDYLRDDEINALFGYLTRLAGSSGAGSQQTVEVSWARLGEHVVKGTCHICHDAVGARPTAAALGQGAIPSLQSLMTTKPVTEFVRKARAGAPVKMGDPALFHRGRMPVFHYLRDEEVAAAYTYLATYPPRATP